MSLSEKNPARVRFDRASIDSAIEAAKQLKSDRELYVFATYLGYTIDHRPPPGMQQYVVVHPDGSTETIKPGVGENPVPEAKAQPYLEKYRKLVEKYPDRIDKHLERAKDEKASLVLGREFGESFDDYLERHPDVKRRWDELTIAIGEMEQLNLANPFHTAGEFGITGRGIADESRAVILKDGTVAVDMPTGWSFFTQQGAHIPLDKISSQQIDEATALFERLESQPTNPINPSSDGRCYEEAWRFLIKQGEGELVHGTVLSAGRRIGHAWVELPTGYIWEPQTGSYFTHGDFLVAAEPIEEHRYSGEEAAIMLARVGKHGPWTDEERARWLHSGNPREERGGTVGNPAYQVGEKLIVTIGGRDIEGWVVNTKTTKDHFIRYIVRIGPDKYYEASYGQLKRAKGGSPMANEGKHYFCDNTALHPNNEVVQIKTLQDNPKCPYCGAIMTYGRYWGPLPATQMSEKGGNPMTTEEIEQVASKVAAKVLNEITPSVLDPGGRGMMIHFTEHAIEGSGLVVNEAKARETPCNCFTYKDREYCFSPGVIGMMSSEENPEQLAAFCKVGKTHEVKPGMKRRFESFAGAAEEAHKKIETIPKGERLVPWLTAMGEELEKRGIEV